MSRRKIIKIDLEKCNGCGLCIPSCPEGAIQLIDGKARLISDLFCDGLGACLGSCPQDAITIEEREAEDYDERKVMENIVKQGKNTILAHLKHLKDHGQKRYFQEAIEFLKEKNLEVALREMEEERSVCAGAKIMELDKEGEPLGKQPSFLRQWPIQLHLVMPTAPYYEKADVLLVADCVAYAYGNFHHQYLRGRSIAIACPKLDRDRDIYIDKIRALIDEAKINTLTVMIMEVPCCRGLLSLAQQGLEKAKRKIPLKLVVVGIQGNIVSEEWI